MTFVWTPGVRVNPLTVKILAWFLFDGNIGPKLLNSLSANIKKWSNTLKQFVGNLRANCLSVLDHFMGLTLKKLKSNQKKSPRQRHIQYPVKQLCWSFLVNIGNN